MSAVASLSLSLRADASRVVGERTRGRSLYRYFFIILAILAVISFWGGACAYLEIRKAHTARQASAAEETVIVSAYETRARAIARILLASKLPQLLDARSKYYQTDSRFLEDLLSAAIASLLRYSDVSNSERMGKVVGSLRDGRPEQAIDHVKRVVDAQIDYSDKLGFARSQMYLGALFLLTDPGGSRALWRASYELDASLFSSCRECLERFIAKGGMAIATLPDSQRPESKGTKAPPKTLAEQKTATPKQTNVEQRDLAPASSSEPSDSVVTPAPEINTTATSDPDPATISPPAPARVAPDLKPIIRYEPEYPERALARGKEGYAIVSFSILPSGLTTDVMIVESQPKGYFEIAAKEAVWKWRYPPQQLTVPNMRARFEFQLR